MQDVNAEITRFLNACEELITGKFILADSKIGELLKSVAASEELTRLFQAVTEGYDYASAKRAYLRAAESRASRGTAYLPSDRREILAFVFCLLAEFDCGAMNFNDFLLRYFYEDGSYTASYALFTDRMLAPFRDIVRDCYAGLGKRSGRYSVRAEEGVFDALTEKLSVERARIASLSLSEEDAVAGETILAGLYAAAGRKDRTELKALLCGYLYFLNTVGAENENSNEIFHLASEL